MNAELLSALGKAKDPMSILLTAELITSTTTSAVPATKHLLALLVLAAMSAETALKVGREKGFGEGIRTVYGKGDLDLATEAISQLAHFFDLEPDQSVEELLTDAQRLNSESIDLLVRAHAAAPKEYKAAVVELQTDVAAFGSKLDELIAQHQLFVPKLDALVAVASVPA